MWDGRRHKKIDVKFHYLCRAGQSKIIKKKKKKQSKAVGQQQR
jgi:hypothetical protein